MSGYENLVVAICKAAISDYTKEICKMKKGLKYSTKEIQTDVNFILNSELMEMLYSKEERINLLKRVLQKAKEGYWYHDTKEVWKNSELLLKSHNYHIIVLYNI